MLFNTALAQLFLAALVASQHANPMDFDPLDEMDEKEFEEYFHLTAPDDPEEFKRREEALKEHEKEIHEINEEFEAGEISWYDAINEYVDLPDDEFLHQHAGAITNFTEGRGLLNPLETERVDPASEAYFRQVMLRRGSSPSQYDSRRYGLVSPVKRQLKCGSCVAFSSMATVETCFAKVSGDLGDFSEQQFVDCGYGKHGADGCDGAPPHAYIKYWGDNKLGLAHESQYPYLNNKPRLTCPSLPTYNRGAEITGSFYSYSANEDLLKQLVYEHGAVVTSVKSEGPFMEYKGGIFAGCNPGSDTDHAVAVVGYGTENGIDYWVIKNSWGDNWGENGFIRLKRGVGMCGVGSNVAAIKCGQSSKATNAPLTTQAPCFDNYTNCPEMAATSCWQTHIADGCKKSCGLCAGMTPVRSYTCYDKFNNCGELGAYCSQTHIAEGCKITCGKC